MNKVEFIRRIYERLVLGQVETLISELLEAKNPAFHTKRPQMRIIMRLQTLIHTLDEADRKALELFGKWVMNDAIGSMLSIFENDLEQLDLPGKFSFLYEAEEGEEIDLGGKEKPKLLDIFYHPKAFDIDTNFQDELSK